jgi:hypothetical protein
MRQRIAGFRLDDAGDWVAELDCGHRQHVRHRPPFQLRAWVLDEAGRASRVGTPIDCPLCDEPGQVPATGGRLQTDADDGGDPACWAHLFCPECGNELAFGHAPGCGLSDPAR